MSKHSNDKFEEEFIIDIAYNNILLKGFLERVLEDKAKKEKEIEEKNKRNEGKDGKKGDEGKNVKKDPLNEIIEKHSTFLDTVLKSNFNKSEVIKKTMDDKSQKIDKGKIIEFLNNRIFPRIFDMLSSQKFLLDNLSPQILNIISNTYKIFIKIIKKEMVEYEKMQNIIAESLLEKDVLENIKNKLRQRKKIKIKNNKEETTISNTIYESKKIKYFSNPENEANIESLKKYITELEDELKEKQAFISEILLEEYIHEENYQKYQNIIQDKINQIAQNNSKIHELEIDKKKLNSEKTNLRKDIFGLNNQIEQIKNKVTLLSKEKSRLDETILKLSKENEELKNNVFAITIKKEEFEINCANLSRQNNELNEKIILLTDENNSLNGKMYDNNNKIRRLQDDILLMNLKIERKDAKIQNMGTKIEYLEQENKQLIAQLDDKIKINSIEGQ